jgi:triacylglycerol lipase
LYLQGTLMTSRRLFLGLVAAVLAAGCVTGPSIETTEPIVFVHGNGDSASIWQTTIWRFESNGWPRDRLHAIDMPYPLARTVDAKPEPGRSSTAEHMAYLKSEVDKVLKDTGARQVILIGNSRGPNAIRDYIQNGGGEAKVSHAILSGGIIHGVQAIPGLNEGNEFSGTGPYLASLNKPKNSAGDEVTSPVKWLTIRSENNDKYAQPEGRWLGMPGKPTNLTYAAPELRGATNVVIPRIDHRETAFSPAAFEAMYRFITGHAPETTAVRPEQKVILSGKVSGLGVFSTDPASGNFANNLPLPGAHLQIFATDAASGERRGSAAYDKMVGSDGLWGPFTAHPQTQYEFVVSAPGYATTHIYRSPFPRSSSVINMRPERIADADKAAAAIITMTRPRGYFDPARDKMSFDGQSPPPGALPGAGVASSKIKPTSAASRSVVAEFNGERLVGRVWPAANNEVAVLELTY